MGLWWLPPNFQFCLGLEGRRGKRKVVGEAVIEIGLLPPVSAQFAYWRSVVQHSDASERYGYLYAYSC